MSLNILFIDDEPDLCELYEDLFSSDEIVVHTFEHCCDAIEFSREHQVDLCFIDYRMPKMNGLECRKKISSEIPCYLVTGELKVKEAESFKEVIEKPLTEEKFKQVIQKETRLIL